MKRVCFLMLLLPAMCQSTWAIGALYGRRALSNDSGRPLWLKEYHADVRITDQMAVTHVDHTFKNESSSRMEGIFIFPLPDNAVVTELALWIKGERVVGEVMEKREARKKYESIVRRQIDPALLEDMGDNIFKLSVFPIEPDGRAMSQRRIEITYVELLPYQSHTVSYEFLMKTSGLSAKPVGRASLTVDLAARKDITALSTPNHVNDTRLSQQKKSDGSYHLVYGNENAHSEKDLVLDYELENTEYALQHITYVPDPELKMPFDSAGDDPYFLMWVTPPDDITTSKVLRKDIVMVADISSSMSGTRITQLRAALSAMIDMLNDGDRFNIVAFSTSVRTLADSLMTADAETKERAKQFVDGLSELGLTNMEEALGTALASRWDSEHVDGVIFFTDGRPTWPIETSPAAVLDTVESGNTSDVAVHTFGVGEDIDEEFLRRLARENSGFYYHITADNQISPTLSAFMKRISYPLIKDIALNYGTLSTYDTYPAEQPNLYAGSQLTVLGRYRNACTARIAFSGTQRGNSFQLIEQLAFPSPAANHPFVPRSWASAKIDALLDDIGLYGERTELVDQVKYLGGKYGIITPYTSMLVQEPQYNTGGQTGGNTPVLEDKTVAAAQHLRLPQNAPNPFVKTTSLRFGVPRLKAPRRLTLSIYDSKGRLVRILADRLTTGGNFVVQWDGRDAHGAPAAPGTYVAVLRVGTSRRMIAMRLVG